LIRSASPKYLRILWTFAGVLPRDAAHVAKLDGGAKHPIHRRARDLGQSMARPGLEPGTNRGHHDFQPPVLRRRMWSICSGDASASYVAVFSRIPALSSRLQLSQAHAREPVPKRAESR
jgi:hypothetical protein